MSIHKITQTWLFSR